MSLELDHLFICTRAGAPEAEQMIALGLTEGPPNTHAGQGTANRRFFFRDGMIELLWVHDMAEAQSEETRSTQLYDRWRGRSNGACPFGFILRRASDADGSVPFPAREYRPAWLTVPGNIFIGEAGIEEPMWVYMDFLRHAPRDDRFTVHPLGLRAVTTVTLITPEPMRSNAAEAIIRSGAIRHRTGEAFAVEIAFDEARRGLSLDLRPTLPLMLHA